MSSGCRLTRRSLPDLSILATALNGFSGSFLNHSRAANTDPNETGHTACLRGWNWISLDPRQVVLEGHYMKSELQSLEKERCCVSTGSISG